MYFYKNQETNWREFQLISQCQEIMKIRSELFAFILLWETDGIISQDVWYHQPTSYRLCNWVITKSTL